MIPRHRHFSGSRCFCRNSLLDIDQTKAFTVLLLFTDAQPFVKLKGAPANVGMRWDGHLQSPPFSEYSLPTFWRANIGAGFHWPCRNYPAGTAEANRCRPPQQRAHTLGRFTQLHLASRDLLAGARLPGFSGSLFVKLSIVSKIFHALFQGRRVKDFPVAAFIPRTMRIRFAFIANAC